MQGLCYLIQDCLAKNIRLLERLLICVKFGCAAQWPGQSVRHPGSIILGGFFGGQPAFTIHQYPMRRPLQIVKLPRSHRPPEQAGNHKDKNDRNRDQQVKGFQLATPSLETVGTPTYLITLRCNRSEFKTTQSELNDMPIPASQGVNRPAIATGRATAL